MDYKKKYEEILGRARTLSQRWCGVATIDTEVALQELKEIFPELEDSEHERIRKDLIEFIRHGNCVFDSLEQKNKFWDWLERQKITQNTNKEDEEVRQYIIRLMKQRDTNVPMVQKALAWLEKQGVQKNTCQPNNTYGNVKFPFRARVKSSDTIITIQDGQLSMDGKEWIKYQSDSEDGYRFYKPDELELVYDVEQNQVNMVEPKFKVGDWIVIDNPCKIISIDNYGNYLVRYWDFDTTDKLHTLSKEFCETYFHLWTIQDAKDGDVLTTKNFIFIFSDIDDDNCVRCYCHYEISDHEEDDLFEVAFPLCWMGRVGNGLSYYSPATKEQCDLLFSKMKEAGYEWDAENGELKKVELKSGWSEEDEKTFNTVIEKGDLKLSEIDWLKSLKERVQPKQSIGRIFINKHF